MNNESTVECWECGKVFPDRVSLIQRVSYLIFCKSCWAVHPWNPKEILKTS